MAFAMTSTAFAESEETNNKLSDDHDSMKMRLARA